MTIHNSGILGVFKPHGWTSYDVVNFAKKRWKLKKVGHTGTLDPIAEGVLILCLGSATRLSSLFLNLRKSYSAKIRFGISTDTDDITGEPLYEKDISHLTADEILKAMEMFYGVIEQIPPKYSALKIKGKPAYILARKGGPVNLKERQVEIYRFEMKDVSLPEVTVDIECSKGTYIRSIARDWGEKLGVGGILVRLMRTSIGNISLGDCHTIEELENLDSPPLLDFEYATSFIKRVKVPSTITELIKNGEPLQFLSEEKGIEFPSDGVFLLLNQNGLPIALAEKDKVDKKHFRYLAVFPEW